MANDLIVPATIENEIAEGFRCIAIAFADVADFRGFISGVAEGLQRAGLVSGVALRFDLPPPQNAPVADANKMDVFGFQHGELNVPVVGQRQLHGVLRVARDEENHRFGPEDLHALSTLAAFLASVADHAVRYGDARRAADVLRFVLDLAPVGFVVFDSAKRVIVANSVARSWLGDTLPAQVAQCPEPGKRTHLRLGGKLILAETTTPRETGNSAGVHVLSLVDLTSEQTTLLNALARELYRAKWQKTSLTFVLLENVTSANALLSALPELRANLGVRDIVGPYDAQRIGLIFPEQKQATVVRQLRRTARLFDLEQIRAALVPVDASMNDPEDVLRSALDQMRPFSEWLRPAVLLHDDYPAVNDMLELVLRRDFRVVKSNALGHTRELLRTESFDAILTELDLREGESGLSLARDALELQPELKAFFTASADRARCREDDPLLTDNMIFGKPFTVEEVVARLRRVLFEQAAATVAKPPGK